MPDTVGIYIKTRVALANSNFIVRENYNMDTVSTHLKELDAIKGYMATNAIISGNTVTFSGIYGLKRISAWGYTRLPGGYTRIIFYSGSKTWRELLGIAIKMRGEISYSD